MVELAKATYTYGAAAEEYVSSKAIFVGDGISFAASNKYQQNKVLNTTPNTFEAWIKVPDVDRPGLIIGNYGGTGSGFNFEINTKRNPRLYWMLGTGDPESIVFDTTLPVGEWIHLVITRDTVSGNAYCYVNGELKGTKSLAGACKSDLPAMKAPLVLGGDLRSGNGQYFKGEIKSVSLYSQCLTAAEIAENYSASKPVDRSSLICYYYLAFASASDDSITDFSGNGYTINK
jgi:hypothetical protein